MLNQQHFKSESKENRWNILQALKKNLASKNISKYNVSKFTHRINISNICLYADCELEDNKSNGKMLLIFNKYYPKDIWETDDGKIYNFCDNNIYKLENGDFAVISEDAIRQLASQNILYEFQSVLLKGRIIGNKGQKGTGVSFQDKYFHAKIKISADPRLLCNKPLLNDQNQTLLIFNIFKPKHHD